MRAELYGVVDTRAPSSPTTPQAKNARRIHSITFQYFSGCVHAREQAAFAHTERCPVKSEHRCAAAADEAAAPSAAAAVGVAAVAASVCPVFSLRGFGQVAQFPYQYFNERTKA